MMPPMMWGGCSELRATWREAGPHVRELHHRYGPRRGDAHLLAQGAGRPTALGRAEVVTQTSDDGSQRIAAVECKDGDCARSERAEAE